jgi:hypothetical protein
MSEETTPSAPKPLTGYAIFVDPEGNVFVERNIGALSVEVQREATMVEVRRTCSEILMDLQAQASAEYTVLRMKTLLDDAKAVSEANS